VIRRYERVELEDIKDEFSSELKITVNTRMNGDTGKISAAKEEMFGELVLSSSPCSPDPADAAKSVIMEALRRQMAIPDAGDKKANHFFCRVTFAAKQSPEEFPAWHEPEIWKDFLLENIASAGNIRSFADLKNMDVLAMMRNDLGYEKCSLLDRLYPEFFVTPAGARHPIDYSGVVPEVSAKVQEFYGVKQHPCVGKNKLPLKINLLSPALRSTQITSDLPGFWKNSWHLVRKDMKSRYPKHDWPEDPANSVAHTKVRPS
jgi:ATP-dependent helicase HrpB